MPIDKMLLERIHTNDPSLPIKLSFCAQNITLDDIRELAEALQTNNYVTALDLNNNLIEDEGGIILAQLNNITWLSIAGNQLGEKGSLALSQNKSIIFLDASDNKLNDKDAATLASNRVITTLNIAGNQITNIGASAFTDNSTLISLNLTENQINDEGTIALGKNKNLTSLTLTRNQIGDKGAIALAKHPKLITLILSYNKIGSEGGQALANNAILTRLDLSYNKLTAPGVSSFINNHTLKTLGVAGNQINNWGTKALLKNKSIISLDVSYNQVSDEGITNLLDNQNLLELNLNSNLITPEGAKILALHPKLDKLYIRYNLLGDDGATALAQSKNIAWLDVSGNQVGPKGAESLAKNNRVKSLIFSYNIGGNEGAIALAQNTTLRELWISYNEIGDEGAIALAHNNFLVTLGVNYNYIGSKGREALKKNKTLQLLQISDEQPPQFTAENLSTTFLLSQDFLCIRTKDGIIQFFNPAFSRVLGYLDDEILGKSIYDLVHPHDRLKEIKLAETEQKFPIYYHENRYKCKDGSYRTIWWSSQLKHNRVYTVGTDITEQKEVEKELSKKEKKIGIDTIFAKAAEAYAKDQANFIAHLCHEIRNPLSGIYGNVEIIRDQVDHLQTLINSQAHLISSAVQVEASQKIAEIHEGIEAMVTCIEYQKSILDDNLDIAKIAEKKFVLENNIFDLKKNMYTVIKMFKASAEKKGLDLKVEFPKESLQVKGDVARLKKIIINLIGNAIKFTEKGHITVEIMIQAQTTIYTEIEIKVTDTGIGLDQGEIPGLFERFSQASVGNQYGGSGLGLLIAKSLSQLMGGDIKVESQKGKGSIFSCVIRCENLNEEERKLFVKEESDKEKLAMPAPIHPTLLPPSKKAKILIVDDNDMNRRALGYLIEKGGYECLFAVNGKEAIEKHSTSPVNLILMDLTMPIMGGVEATQLIRQHEISKGLSSVPIIAVTGNAMEIDRKKALEVGINDYLTKPFSKKEILQKIASYLTTVTASETASALFVLKAYPRFPEYDNSPQVARKVPALLINYQQIFIETVKQLLSLWKKKFLENSVEYQFIHGLENKVFSLQGSDEVFKKISSTLKMPEYEQVKDKLAPLRRELITKMKQYNSIKSDAIICSQQSVNSVQPLVLSSLGITKSTKREEQALELEVALEEESMEKTRGKKIIKGPMFP